MNINEYWSDSYGYGPLEEAGFERGDVAKVIHWREGENDYASWLAVLKLTNGKFAYVEAWCDYTGWDCQAGSEVTYADSLAELVPEMTTEGRMAFGYEPTPDCGV